MDEYRLDGVSCFPCDVHEVWSLEDSDELRDTLHFERRILLEEVWGKLRKILDNCKDNCKRQGILIALRIVEEKMTEYEEKDWGKAKRRRDGEKGKREIIRNY